MKLLRLLAAPVVLIGCASNDSETSTATQLSAPAASATSVDIATAASDLPTSVASATGQPGVQAEIEIGGGQLLGLAADADSVWPISYDNGTISKVDPASNKIAAVVDLGAGAASALAVDGDVWVAGYGQSESALYQVDAASATLTATHQAGELCCDLSSGEGSLWAVNPAGSAVEIDLATGKTVQTIPIVVDRNAHINAVYADGLLWFASDTTALSRLDPQSGVIDQFDVGGGVPFLARDGLLWGASPTTVWAVDGDGQVVEHIDLSRSIEVISLEVHGSDVWAGIRHPGHVGAVQQIDRSSARVLNEFHVDIPARMVIGFGSLWVTDSGSNKLYRIGPLD